MNCKMRGIASLLTVEGEMVQDQENDHAEIDSTENAMTMITLLGTILL